MDTIVKRTVRAKIYDFVTQRVVYHTAFWVTMLLLLLVLDASQISFFSKLSREFINVIFYGAIVYFNLFYLIPNYLINYLN